MISAPYSGPRLVMHSTPPHEQVATTCLIPVELAVFMPVTGATCSTRLCLYGLH